MGENQTVVDIPYHLRLLAQPAESIVRDVAVYTGQFVALQMYQTFIQVGIMILVVMKSACGGLVLNHITSFQDMLFARTPEFLSCKQPGYTDSVVE